MKITREYLEQNPDYIFVFGDNIFHYGRDGAAKLRGTPNTYGFVTKHLPCNEERCFYKPTEYTQIYRNQLYLLKIAIRKNPDKIFLISRLGSGLANRYGIFETVIEPNIKYDLSEFENVRFLW